MRYFTLYTWMKMRLKMFTFMYCLKTSAAVFMSTTLYTINLQKAARRFLLLCKASILPASSSWCPSITINNQQLVVKKLDIKFVCLKVSWMGLQYNRTAHYLNFPTAPTSTSTLLGKQQNTQDQESMSCSVLLILLTHAGLISGHFESLMACIHKYMNKIEIIK